MNSYCLKHQRTATISSASHSTERCVYTCHINRPDNSSGCIFSHPLFQIFLVLTKVFLIQRVVEYGGTRQLVMEQVFVNRRCCLFVCRRVEDVVKAEVAGTSARLQSPPHRARRLTPTQFHHDQLKGVKKKANSSEWCRWCVEGGGARSSSSYISCK